MPFFDHPARVSAALALALRAGCGALALAHNPLVSRPQLDSAYYLQWAREIARGDVAGTGGIVGGAPFILNPLYAYAIAPFAALADDPTPAVVFFQAALGAGTAALAALAALRLFGRAAAWTAGLGVAFSAALVELDLHLAVSGLAAFLVAGAVFASAPDASGGRGRGHGPLARGLWLGLGALARPVTPLALPFFAWDVWKGGGRRGLAVLAFVGAFGACALPSLVRNWAVSGEPFLYTSASGINLHIGNNAESRRMRTMVSPYTRFEPQQMHEDARRVVLQATGRDPSPAEVSSHFQRMAVDAMVREPGPSALFLAQKARWFYSPVEAPSTASLANDRRFVPALHAAFVPTWLLAAAGAAGLILHLRRREVVCGPGALFLAHWAVLTLVFPLSHYRSPAVPALAVLAGGVVQSAVAAWREGARRRTAGAVALAAAFALCGALPPQPDRARHSDAMLLAFDARDRGDFDASVAHALEARGLFLEDHPDEPELAVHWTLIGEVEGTRGRYEESIEALGKSLALEPRNWKARLLRSKSAQGARDLALAESDARAVVETHPRLPIAHARLAEVLTLYPARRQEAAHHAQVALALGGAVDPEALRRLGLR